MFGEVPRIMGEKIACKKKPTSVIMQTGPLAIAGGDVRACCGHHRIMSSQEDTRIHSSPRSSVDDDDVNNNNNTNHHIFSTLCGCGGLLLRRPPFATLVHAAVWDHYIGKKLLRQ